MNQQQVEDFIQVIKECEGSVWLESIYGDRFNLKSVLSRYVAIGKLITEEGEYLELFASSTEDEIKLMKFLSSLKEKGE